MGAENSQAIHSKLDSFGACVSFACAVHCIAVPFVITLLPLIGLGFMADHNFEAGMLVFAVILAAASLCWGTRVHKKSKVLLFLLAAGILFAVGFFAFEGLKHWLFIAFGGSCLATGHIVNRRLCRSCAHCAHD